FVDGPAMSFVRLVLSWLQIAVILIVVYGGQLVLRDGTAQLQTWGAFPPAWLDNVPVARLARLIETASTDPVSALPAIAGCLLAGIVATVAALWRVEQLCRKGHRAEGGGEVAWPLASNRLGGLSGYGANWFCRGPEERAG